MESSQEEQTVHYEQVIVTRAIELKFHSDWLSVVDVQTTRFQCYFGDTF